MVEDISTGCLQTKLQKALQIINKYEWLINAYVLDFYVDEHWEKLPASWRQHMEALPPEHLTELLLDSNVEGDGAGGAVVRRMWPLTLLSLRTLLRDLCVSRKENKFAVEDKQPCCALVEHAKLKHIFTKCVKPKKRHEIERMAAFCKRSCAQTPVDFVVDFGAGLGHLARVLGYGCGIRVCCLEMQEALNVQAGTIDLQFEARASKYLPATQTAAFQRPTHLTLRLTAEMRPADFLATLRQALQLPDNNFRFGIVGLHPCGDLCAILMRMFLDCAQAQFLNFVGCCYMKLTTLKTHSNSASKCGYPLSAYLQRTTAPADLSYEAREISCHAVEMYGDRLGTGDYEYLRVHSFRAAAERILVKHSKALRHCGLRSVKHVPGMRFEDYFYKAVQGLTSDVINLPATALQSATTKADILHWKRIVIFYTLRLMLAPLVESVVLYDRILFLRENHCHVDINAIFDPRLSPRNHITSAVKPS